MKKFILLRSAFRAMFAHISRPLSFFLFALLLLVTTSTAQAQVSVGIPSQNGAIDGVNIAFDAGYQSATLPADKSHMVRVFENQGTLTIVRDSTGKIISFWNGRLGQIDRRLDQIKEERKGAEARKKVDLKKAKKKSKKARKKARAKIVANFDSLISALDSEVSRLKEEVRRIKADAHDFNQQE